MNAIMSQTDIIKAIKSIAKRGALLQAELFGVAYSITANYAQNWDATSLNALTNALPSSMRRHWGKLVAKIAVGAIDTDTGHVKNGIKDSDNGRAKAERIQNGWERIVLDWQTSDEWVAPKATKTDEEKIADKYAEIAKAIGQLKKLHGYNSAKVAALLTA